jgi:hypothetical protein
MDCNLRKELAASEQLRGSSRVYPTLSATPSGNDRSLRETAAHDVHCRSRWFNGNRVSRSPLGPDAPRRLGWMIGAARDCSRARKRVARRKRSLDRLVERAFSLRTPLTPRPLRCLPHTKSLPCLQLAAQLAKRRCVRIREEANGSEAVKAHGRLIRIYDEGRGMTALCAQRPAGVDVKAVIADRDGGRRSGGIPATRRGIEAIWATNAPNTSAVEIDGAGTMRRRHQCAPASNAARRASASSISGNSCVGAKPSSAEARTACASAGRPVD